MKASLGRVIVALSSLAAIALALNAGPRGTAPPWPARGLPHGGGVADNPYPPGGAPAVARLFSSAARGVDLRGEFG